MVKVSEEIDWLKKNDDRRRIFDFIAMGLSTASELRRRVGASDWWMVGVHLEDLVKHGLIVMGERGYMLTEAGLEVHGTLRRVGEIKEV